MIKVKECLGKELVTVNRGTPLREIINFFHDYNFHILPVVDDKGFLQGKITLNEITSVFQPHSAEIHQLLESMPFMDTVPDAELDIDYITPEMGILVVADEIMSDNYFTVSPESSIMHAHSLMKKHSTKLLMVTDEENKLVGVLGLFDIIFAIFRRKGIIK